MQNRRLMKKRLQKPEVEPAPIGDLLSDIQVSRDSADRFHCPTEARKKAMDYLARREHSRDELSRKMVRAGFPVEVALDAIDDLQKDGLQSDRRFVEAFVQSRISQGKGPARIRADLVQRGIRDAMIQEVLGETEQDWSALAVEVRQKKFGLSPPKDFKAKAQQMRFLQYRGFEQDQIREAVSASAE
jgi:regulatory protein